MATGRIANGIWGMTSDISSILLRNDWEDDADYLYTNRNRLSPPWGVTVFSFGIGLNMDWAYRVLSYTPPDPDPIGGGAFRPSVGQLTP